MYADHVWGCESQPHDRHRPSALGLADSARGPKLALRGEPSSKFRCRCSYEECNWGMSMPVNHGLYRKLPESRVKGQRILSDAAPVFRYGIRTVFDAMTRGNFLAGIDHRRRSGQLEYHFSRTCERFVFSLQHLNVLMQEMSRLHGLRDGMPPTGLLELGFQAGTHADHVLSYLGTIIDDLAIGVTLATGYFGPNANKPIDSMGKLKDQRSRTELAPVAQLLAELDKPTSWWELGFKTKAGGRQLIVHNQHLVEFQAVGQKGGPFKASAHIISVWSNPTVPFTNFFALLRDILEGLCNWLDRLQDALMTHLRPRDPSWSPMSLLCPVMLLPVGWPSGVTVLDPVYFPLPLCDGSDELPWKFKGP